MGKSRVTIKDLARELNISTSTVSRALSDQWDVNPETRAAVLALAEKMNYRPNPISLSLKSRLTRTVGVVVPEFINSYFPEVIMGIQGIMDPAGFQVLITQSNESAENELRNLKALEEKMVDGLIVSVTQETQKNDYYQTLEQSRLPLVFFNRIYPEVDASFVMIDDYKWSFAAVEHLIEEGCRRIAHLAGPENLSLSRQRENGYRDALAKHGLEVDESLIIPCGVMIESGVIGAHKLLEHDRMPDGIFAVTDPVAIGAMKTLQKNGVEIPGDVAVVGFSESPLALIIEPNLTSVEQPTFEIGKLAAEMLLEQIRNSAKDIKTPVRSVVLDAKLNIRESSLKNQR